MRVLLCNFIEDCSHFSGYPCPLSVFHSLKKSLNLKYDSLPIWKFLLSKQNERLIPVRLSTSFYNLSMLIFA